MKVKGQIRNWILVLGISMWPMFRLWATDPDSVSRKSVFSHSFLGNKPQKQTLQLPFLENTRMENLGYSGTVDFVSFYRNMSTAYPDMQSPMKDLQFTPYPGGNQYNANFYRQPLLNLFISGSPSSSTSFAIEYAMSHFYSGQGADSSKKLNVQNVLQFHGHINTSFGNFQLTAGGGAMNYSMSPFTMYNKDFREPMFEKLPWDWYTNSFQKYKDQFAYSATTSPSYLTNTATQGFILEGTDLPANFAFSAFYGRSSYTTTPDRVDKGYPVEIIAGRVQKGRDSTGKIGINYYNLFGYTDRVKRIPDSREILTGDFQIRNRRIKLYAEGGAGNVRNPLSTGKLGIAASLGFTLYNKKLRMPIYLQAYTIDLQVAALESAVLNANSSVVQGGYGTDPRYNNGYYPAFLQEVSMMSNNRNGVILKVDKIWNKVQVELGNAISQEKENVFNGVSFGQMVNAFSRSRFSPWLQGAGPYGRVNNRFRRTFETLMLTDSSGALKTFNAADLSLKWRFNLFKRELILYNYNYLGSIGKELSLVPAWSESSYLRTFFEEISAYYDLHNKLTLIGFCSIQTNQGNQQTALSPENSQPLNQLGTGYGFGIDYDFATSAGLYLRQRWMENTDANFSADKFKGTETMIELKVFF